MERFRVYDPNQQVMVILNPSNSFGEDSFEVFLVNLINTLDTSHFWPHKDRGGETPYDPRAMLGIILYGFCRGIFSSRKLESACLTDIGFMYVSGHNTPDHAAICRFLKCWRPQLKEVFAQIVYLAYEKGFIDYKYLSIDGTKIKANASKAFTGTISDFRRRLSSIELSIEESIARFERNETNKKVALKKIDKKIRDKNRISDFLNESTAILNRQGKEKKQNITDPDCRLMLFSDGTVHEAYNAQACVDGVSGLIVAPEVSQEENDRRLLTPILSKVIIPKKINNDKCRVLADSGYWEPNELSTAESEYYELYIPSQTHAYPLSSKGNTKRWEMKSFEKDETGIYGICPGDRRFRARDKIRTYSDGDKGGPYYVFHLKKSQECGNCPSYESCWGKTKKDFRLVINSIHKVDNFSVIKKIEKRLLTPAGKEIYSRRMPMIERIFAEIKSNIGFKKFLRTGIKNVQTEWNMICMAYNLKRLYNSQRV